MRVSAVLALAGCGAAAFAAPSFNQDIAPILYKHCATCHRPGEVAPFSLLTYQDAAKRARLIATVTRQRYMPPWKPEPGYGKFLHERRLTDEEIATLGEWAAAGAPEGDPRHKPAPPEFPEGWQIGQPDHVVRVSEPYTVPADGPDQFRCFVLPTGLDRDVYVSGAEFRPGNRRVVHHALVFLDTTGRARRMARAAGGSSYPCFGGAGFGGAGLVMGWAPGYAPFPPEPSLSQPLSRGTDIVVQIHYHPSGKPETDQSSLGLVFSGPPTKGRALMLVVNRNIDIPAGERNYVVKASMTVPQDAELWGITPHAHYLCVDMKVTATLPDGSKLPLIWIKDWDFNWQGQYRYETPIHLPKDTRIDLEFTYDNSSGNAHNPSNPPVRVRWGEQTSDEMAVAFLGMVLPSASDGPVFQRGVVRQLVEDFVRTAASVDDVPEEIPPQQAAQLRLVLRTFDRNANGKLDPEEREALLQLVRTMLR
jgi:hypothetical protein